MTVIIDPPADYGRAAPHVVGEVLEQLEHLAVDVVGAVRPRTRGWLHAGLAPLALLGGLLLVGMAPAGESRVAAGVFAVAATWMFAVSGIYNTVGPRMPAGVEAWLQRLDHASIFVLIGGTYTPFATLLLEDTARAVLLVAVWTGVLLGVAFRVAWVGAPRWLYVAAYLGLGWAALFVADDIAGRAAPLVTTLLVAGGVVYTLGAVAYAFRRPNPLPAWFGFHEVFHACTVAAFAAHFAAAWLVTMS